VIEELVAVGIRTFDMFEKVESLLRLCLGNFTSLLLDSLLPESRNPENPL